MNKTKKNGFLKAACLMLSVTMLATCVVSGTMAKYTTSSPDISAKAKIAKWSIKVGDEELKSLTETDLDFTILDTKGESPYTEEHVKDKLIAPGTWGYAKVEIKNESEVVADISATFTKDSTGGLPEGMTVVPLAEEPKSPDDVTGETLTVSTRNVEAETGTASIFVAFKWEFGDSEHNETDTEKGEAAISDPNLTLGTLKITADQVD